MPRIGPMCRLFGAAASAPIDVSFELLRSDNSILRQSERHDSGWGSAYYSADGEPEVRRFAEAAHAAEEFDEVTSGQARVIMVHVRRATIGDLKLENTHPFAQGRYTFCHNGTILKAAKLVPPAGRAPGGDTDSERFFNLLMTGFEADDVVGSLRRTVERICDECRFSALNFLFCDGRSLYAYRFGVYRLFALVRSLGIDADTQTHHHLHVERPHGGHVALVSSEELDDRPEWTELEQDVLLVCDPDDPDNPRAERLLGARADEIEFVPLDSGELSGAERGRWAGERAAAGF
jgi:predicted glutamine amidotransferase